MGVPLHPDLLFGPAVPPIRSRPNSFYGDPLYYSDYSGDSYSRRSFRRDKSRGRGDSPPRISPGHQQPTRPRSSYAENDPHESDRGKDEFHGGEELERGRYVRGAGYYPPPQPHRQRSRSHGRSLYSREYSDGPVGHHNYGSSSNDENISSPPPPRFAAPAVPPPGAIDPIRQRPSGSNDRLYLEFRIVSVSMFRFSSCLLDRRMADSGQQRPSDSDARTTGTGNRGNGNRSNRDRH